MGEMCDFEAEYYPGNWDRRRSLKPRKNKDVVLALNPVLYAKYKALGGASGIKRLIAAAAIPPADVEGG